MKTKIYVVVLAGLTLGAPGALLAEEGWSKYDAPKYGFSMLIPAGTAMVEKEHEGGWGMLLADADGVKLFGLTKLGEKADAAAIEKVGVKLTGIPASAWKTIDKGENSNGWLWYRTVEATAGGKLIFGGYGVGPKGSYLLLLETTEADYQAHKADYKTWYESVTLK